MDLVGGGYLRFASAIEVVHSPPPLLAHDLDPERHRFYSAYDRVSDSEAVDQQCRQHDYGKEDAAPDDQVSSANLGAPIG
jgi:hypothetical protein